MIVVNNEWLANTKTHMAAIVIHNIVLIDIRVVEESNKPINSQ